MPSTGGVAGPCHTSGGAGFLGGEISCRANRISRMVFALSVQVLPAALAL